MPIDEAQAQRLVLARAARRQPPPGLDVDATADDQALADRLIARDPDLAPWLARLRWPPQASWLVPAAALLGLLTDALGPQGRIELLAAPWLGVLLWNGLVMAASLVRRATPAAPPEGANGAWGTRALATLLRWRFARAAGVSPDRMDWRLRFAHDWLGLAWPLTRARAGALLHAAAAAFAAGLVAGLYARGLVFDYRAGWDSTFLTPGQVRDALGVVLGPASRLAGLPLPDAASIGQIRWSVGPGEPAAPWIHRFALTLALFAILPRCALAWLDRRAAHRLARDFPLPGQKDAAPDALSGHCALLACGWHPDATQRDRLHAVARAAAAPGSAVRWAEDLSPESIDQPGALSLQGLDRLVVVFPLSATPEPQTHGRFLTTAKALAATPGAVLAWADEAPFAARFAGQPTRLAERRRAWQALADAAGVRLVFVSSAPRP